LANPALKISISSFHFLSFSSKALLRFPLFFLVIYPPQSISPNTITGPGTFQEAKCIYHHHVHYNSYTSLLLILCTLRAPIIRELKLHLCSPLRFKFISVGSSHSLGRCSC
jgi:hypothetical protein